MKRSQKIRSYYGIRNMSDKLCRENGLSVVVPGKGSKGKSYAEYQAEKTGTSWKGKLKIAVDALIPQVSSFACLMISAICFFSARVSLRGGLGFALPAALFLRVSFCNR